MKWCRIRAVGLSNLGSSRGPRRKPVDSCLPFSGHILRSLGGRRRASLRKRPRPSGCPDPGVPRRALRCLSWPRGPKASSAVGSVALEVREEDVAATWVKVLDKLSRGEMPPKGEPRPAEEEARAVIAGCSGNCTRPRLPGTPRGARRTPEAEPDGIRNHAPRPPGHAGGSERPPPGR